MPPGGVGRAPWAVASRFWAWAVVSRASGLATSNPRITAAIGPWPRVRYGISVMIACSVAAVVARSNGIVPSTA